MTKLKQFSNDFNALSARENNPWFGGRTMPPKQWSAGPIGFGARANLTEC